MNHYVLIDGQLQKSSPETARWAKRVAKVRPSDTEEKPDAVALPRDTRTGFQIIQELKENE